MSQQDKQTLTTKVLQLGNYQAQAVALTPDLGQGELEPKLWRQLLEARAAGEAAHLVLYRISNIKLLVDTFGPEFGQAIEQELLNRVQKLLRQRESVQRIRLGEFAIAACGLESDAALAAMSQRLVTAGSGRYEIDGAQCRVQAQLGAARYPDDSQQPSELLHFARFALLDQANSSGHCSRFDQQRLQQQKQRLWMEAEMERALEESRFVLQYQPQYSVISGEITGMEALVRLVTVEGTHIPPDSFIPLAEENGFIMRLGRWVIREACQQLARWRRAGYDLPRISVNLSPRQLLDERLLSTIDSAIAATGICHADLELEITEQCVMEGSEAVGEVLGALKARGLRLAIDDFGTGYSSFAYLAWQPLNILKLDRLFLSMVNSDPRVGAIVSAMITMAKELGLEVVAEGVENEDQAQFLRDHGCELAQGFGLARPQDASAIAELLARDTIGGE